MMDHVLVWPFGSIVRIARPPWTILTMVSSQNQLVDYIHLELPIPIALTFLGLFCLVLMIRFVIQDNMNDWRRGATILVRL
jgi:hypothetical protein